MTIVLPVPVAIFMAKFDQVRVCLVVGVNDLIPILLVALSRRAYSVSQMMVSTASIWRQKGRRP